MVGPFVFLDQMGPERLAPGNGLDVAPHPHIGLATVTYLFDGALVHRDSLGVVQTIERGALNWMTAGRGVVHSERTPDVQRATGPSVSGLQVWVALPSAHEDDEPSFVHAGQRELPTVDGNGAHVRVIVGTFAGRRSPVSGLSELAYADVELDPGARFEVPGEHAERAAYLVDGAVAVDGESYAAGRLVVFRERADVVLTTGGQGARLMLLSGEPLDGPRFIWWNFVASSRERIEAAKDRWRDDRFPPVPDETERILLPGEPPPRVDYP